MNSLALSPPPPSTTTTVPQPSAPAHTPTNTVPQPCPYTQHCAWPLTLYPPPLCRGSEVWHDGQLCLAPDPIPTTTVPVVRSLA